MRPVKIITDSCADIGKDLREKYDIDYARMQTTYKDKEQWASLDFEYYTPKELYDIMRNGERVFTNQVPAEEFEKVFSKYLAEGFNIVYIGCSLKLSGSVNTGEVVAKKLLADYHDSPDAEIYCIDSKNSCMAEGALAIRASEYATQGMSAKEVADRITAERKQINMFVTVHSLDCLKRAGRVKASSAFFGNLFGVKPIIISDINGNNTPIKKVKGRAASLAEIVALLKEAVGDTKQERIYIAHADCAEEAEQLREMVKKEIPCDEIYVGYIGPIVGASVGPNTIGVFGFGKEVTFEG